MKPVRILLLETDLDRCGSISSAMQNAGHVVVTMNDLGVLAHLDTFIQVDLIIVDIDGNEKMIPEVEALMNHPTYRDRIVTVLCDCIKEFAPQMQRAGIGHVIVKPLDLDELGRIIKSVLVAAR